MNAQREYQSLCAELGDVEVTLRRNARERGRLEARREQLLESLHALECVTEMEIASRSPTDKPAP